MRLGRTIDTSEAIGLIIGGCVIGGMIVAMAYGVWVSGRGHRFAR